MSVKVNSNSKKVLEWQSLIIVFFLSNSKKSVKFGTIILILRPEVILLMILGRRSERKRHLYENIQMAEGLKT